MVVVTKLYPQENFVIFETTFITLFIVAHNHIAHHNNFGHLSYSRPQYYMFKTTNMELNLFYMKRFDWLEIYYQIDVFNISKK